MISISALLLFSITPSDVCIKNKQLFEDTRCCDYDTKHTSECINIKETYQTNGCCDLSLSLEKHLRKKEYINKYGDDFSSTLVGLTYMDDKIKTSFAFNDMNLDSTIIYAASTSKQITSILVGAAIQQGILKSVEEPLKNLFPHEWISGNVLEHGTLENLLSCDLGLLPDTASLSFALNSSIANAFTYVTGSSTWRVYNLQDVGLDLTDGVDILLKSLYTPNGMPIQYRIDNENDITLSDRVKKYVPYSSSPRAYSSISLNFASIALQIAVETHYGNTDYTTLFFEQWARTTLFEPLGYPKVRISGDGRYVYGGGGMYAPHNFYIELMKLVLDNGKYDEKQIIEKKYIREILNSNNYITEKTYNDKFYRGMWSSIYNNNFAIGFQGNGGMQTIGMPTSDTGRRIISSSRRSFASPQFILNYDILSIPLIENISINEYLDIYSVHRTNAMYAFAESSLKNFTGSIGIMQAAPLDGPLYSTLNETIHWWDSIIL